MVGSVTKRGKSWVLRYYATTPDGKRKQVWLSVRGCSRRQAEKILADKTTEAERGLFADPGKVTVEELMKRWLEFRVEGRLRQGGIDFYEQMARCYIIPQIGPIPLSRLSMADIDRMCTALRKSGRIRDGGPLSKTTVYDAFRTLRAALKPAIKWGLLARNPCDQFDPEDIPKPEEAKTKYLNEEQVGQFLKIIEGDRFYAIYCLAITTGLREAELLGLRWVDIDKERGFLSLSQQLSRTSKGIKLEEPTKTVSGRRSVELSPLDFEILGGHRAAQAEERLLLGDKWTEHGLVFPGPLGRPYHHRGLLRRFKTKLRQAGLPDIPFHGLRHTNSTLLLLAGVHPKIAADRLGHKDATMFMRRYSHVVRGMQQDAAEKLEKLIAPRVRGGSGKKRVQK
jgi:integrase